MKFGDALMGGQVAVSADTLKAPPVEEERAVEVAGGIKEQWASENGFVRLAGLRRQFKPAKRAEMVGLKFCFA
jgi:hypothetical protein